MTIKTTVLKNGAPSLKEFNIFKSLGPNYFAGLLLRGENEKGTQARYSEERKGVILTNNIIKQQQAQL